MDGARYLEDGKLTVFRRNGTYYARLRLSPGKYVTRSLKTSVEETAVQLGRRLLFQLEHRAEQGLPPKSKLFSAVIDDYIRFRERDHVHGKTSAGMLRQIKRVSKFWRGYGGHLPVEDIDDRVMREFIPWRRDYYASFGKLPRNAKLHPTDKTLQWDMMLGKAIVRWAAEQGLRGDRPNITVSFTPKKKRVRPAFERWEYSLRHFYAVSALRNGIGVFEVARNMGTSIQMIQEYYGKQATAAVFATRLVVDDG